MALAAVRDLRDVRPPATAEELEQFETDVLAGFVLRNWVENHLDEIQALDPA